MVENTFSEQTTKNTEYTIKQCPWSQDGYEFVGWNTSPNGSGTSYSVGYVVGSGFSGDVDLYAQWTKNSTPHKLTVIVTSFPNGQGITVKVGDNDGVYISNKQEFPSVLAGTRIVLGTSYDYDQYNIKDDSGNNWDVSEEQYYELEMPDRDYTLNIFVSSSTGTKFQSKDTSGTAVFQGISQELDEGYEYTIKVNLCLIGHYGQASGHMMHCSMGYQRSDKEQVLFYYDSETNQTEEFRGGLSYSNTRTFGIKHLIGRGTSAYNWDGPDGSLGYWSCSQNEDGSWKDNSAIVEPFTNSSRPYGLVSKFNEDDETFNAYWEQKAAFVPANINDIKSLVPSGTDITDFVKGPAISGQTFTIKPVGTGKCIIGIKVKDGGSLDNDCSGIGVFIDIKVTRGNKIT